MYKYGQMEGYHGDEPYLASQNDNEDYDEPMPANDKPSIRVMHWFDENGNLCTKWEREECI